MKFNKEQLDQVKSKIKEVLKDDEFIECLAEKLTESVLSSISAGIDILKAKIQSLEEDNTKMCQINEDMKTDLENIRRQCEGQEQYSRRNCLRLFGILEKDGENTQDLVIKMFKEKLEVDVNAVEIDRVHRLGPANGGRTVTRGAARQDKVGGRPVLVKFISYQTRKLVFGKKKLLKGSGMTLREDLTTTRLDLYKKVVDKYSYKNVWTNDGKIFFKKDDKIRCVSNEAELN